MPWNLLRCWAEYSKPLGLTVLAGICREPLPLSPLPFPYTLQFPEPGSTARVGLEANPGPLRAGGQSIGCPHSPGRWELLSWGHLRGLCKGKGSNISGQRRRVISSQE